MPAALTLAALGLALLAQDDGTAAVSPRDVLATLNVVRLDPAGYGERLGAHAQDFQGSVWAEADGVTHGSIEGPAAVRAAAAAMAASPAVEQLAPDPILAAAARAHVAAQGPTGAIGHTSSAGLTPGLRVRAAGGDVYVSEVIAYGMHDAQDVIRSLIVDDGLPSRGHRKLLLSPFFHYAGIACGPHVSQGTVCVIDLAATPGGKVALPTR